jgi:zinc protease
MAHAEEHMMFRGSPELSAAQLADISASMGGDFDADTQQTVTQYFFTVPAEDLGIALHIESIRMKGVLDTEALWAKERGAIEQEVAQDLSNPEYILYTKLLSALFKGTPYAHDALGTRASFDQTTGTMLQNFHDTWYAPNNATLVIVGDLDLNETLAEIKQQFGGIPAKKLPPHPPIELEPVQPDTLNLKTDLPFGLAVVSFRMPGLESPDFAAAQVLSDVLSSPRGSLYALVPQGKALYADFSIEDLPHAGLGYASAAFPKDGDGTALLGEVRKILSDVVEAGLPADLVEAAKRRARAGLEFEKNSVAGLAMAWSQAVAVEGRSSPEDDMKAIEQVSVADVDRVARNYLTLDQAVSAILTPEFSGKPMSKKSFGGKESFTPEHTGTVRLPDWAEEAVTRLTAPRSALSPVVDKLPNGIELIVQPESISPTVTVFGHIKSNSDLQTPQGKEGVGHVLDQLFSHGTTSLDRIAFQKALDDIAADVSAGTDFSLQVLSDHVERGMALLADLELHPALPEPAFKTIQKQLAAVVAGQLESPEYLAERALYASLLPAGDPVLREATPDTISSLGLDDVKSYYKKVFRPDMTVIAVIGDVKPDDARTWVERYFGDWKSSGPRPDVDLPSIPLNKPSSVVVPNTARVQDEVTLAETLGIDRHHPDYYALQLGNRVLGGGFYASRLYQDLREQTGLVYYVSSSFNVGRTRGFYRVTYGCDPPNVAKARAIVETDLESMQKTPVSEKELARAKALLLREIPLSEASVEHVARGLVERATQDLPLDEPTRAAKKYLKLTPKEVMGAYARWIRPPDLVEVVEGPNHR